MREIYRRTVTEAQLDDERAGLTTYPLGLKELTVLSRQILTQLPRAVLSLLASEPPMPG
jgi:hypothetical protein